MVDYEEINDAITNPKELCHDMPKVISMLTVQGGDFFSCSEVACDVISGSIIKSRCRYMMNSKSLNHAGFVTFPHGKPQHSWGPLKLTSGYVSALCELQISL